MSQSWNGYALVDELAALLGDTSTAFKSRVLGWANDTIFDISTRHEWAYHLVKGKKKLAASTEIHSLEIDAPGAPTLALAAGGTLIDSTAYSVLITFGQDNGVESVGGIASSSVTPTGLDLSINLSAIPVSTESLVTARHLYLKKGSGKYYYHSSIFDNVTTTALIDDDTTGTIEAPDYEAIRVLKGAPFFESGSNNYLVHRDIDQLRLAYQGPFPTGTPDYFSMIDVNSIVLVPVSPSQIEVSFNYFRNPFRLYYSTESQPDLPIYLKPALKAGIITLGYEFRDRDTQELKRANYNNLLMDAISRNGRSADISYQVRDVTGNSDGFEVG